MEMANTNGKMAGSTKGSTATTRSTGKASTHGQTAANTEENGKTAKDTGRAK